MTPVKSTDMRLPGPPRRRRRQYTNIMTSNLRNYRPVDYRRDRVCAGGHKNL